MNIYKAQYKKIETPIGEGELLKSDNPEWTVKYFADLQDAAQWLRELGGMECYEPDKLNKSDFGGGIYHVDFIGKRVERENRLACIVGGSAERYHEQYFGQIYMETLN